MADTGTHADARTGTSIVRIPILPLGMVNAHLVRSERGCILVDSGIPGSERRIGRVLARHGLSLRDIRLIVVTHAHTDHAGSAARLRTLSRAPILAHADDADAYSRRAPMGFCPTGRFGKLFLRTPFPHQPFEGFEPDILMRDGETVPLEQFGIDGVVRHAGGHTPGSVAIELGSRDALVGDLVASGILLGGILRRGRAIRPPFENDPATVAEALGGLVQRGATRFHMGHGGPLPAREVSRHVRSLSALAHHRHAPGACRC